MKILRFAMPLIFVISCITFVNAQPLNEGFDDISTLSASGWVIQNNSLPVGSTSWFQGMPTVYSSQAGANNSYIAANFNNTTGANTISNWLITPPRILLSGDRVSFYTRTVFPPRFADRLQVRLSTAGTSAGTGGTPESVGDFTSLLLDINPTYERSNYPSIWTQYNLTISGVSSPTVGRIAFRYFVEEGGPVGINSEYIGIDTFAYAPVVITAATAFIEGRILTPTGRGLSNTSVILTNQNGETRMTRSSSFGYYKFENLPVETNYVIRAVSKKYPFAPRLLMMSESISGFDIQAETTE